MKENRRQHLSSRTFVLWLPLLLALLLAGSGGVSQAEITTNVGGPIFSNTTWTLANSPYLATNSVQVMAGATLTIEPGVIVRFDAGKALSISGGLVARGTEASPITFTANTANPTPGFWGFIKFENSSSDATFDVDGNYTDGSIVQHALVEYAGNDSNNPASILLDRASPFIDQNVVRHSKYDGIRLSESATIVSGNWVQDSQQYGIYTSNSQGISGQPAILNNTVVGSGYDGIYAYGESDTTRVVVEGNSVRGGTSYWTSGINCSNATVRYNRVYANAGYGIYAQYYCGVFNNIVAYNRNTGIYTQYYGSVSGNKVAYNTTADASSGQPAGIYAWYPNEITYNSIVFNSADAAVPGVNLNYPQSSANCFAYNTLVGQAAPSNTDTGGIYLGAGTIDCQVQHNNLYGNQGYELENSNLQSDGTLDAQFNWWGTTDGSTINNEIWDFFDDGSLAVTNYGNLLTVPDTEAPPAPPTGLQVAVSGNSFDLSWNANAEADIAGYRVFYDIDSGYPYSGTGATQGPSGIDVGNVTNFSLSGLPANKNIYFTVLAYDGSGDPWVGESWYAREVIQAIGGVQNTATPTPTGPTPTDEPATPTPTSTPTDEPATPTPTSTPTDEPATATPTSTPTDEPATPTPTSTPTDEPVTPTPTSTPTDEPATPTPTSTPTVTTVPPTVTPTSTPTATTVPPTPTPTATATTQSPTNTPTATATVEQEYLQVFSIAPAEGDQSSATNVVIQGQGFQGTPLVMLGSHPLESVSRVSSQQLTAVVPAGLPLGTHDLLVTNPDNETVILAQAFTVVSSGPAIAEVRPSQGVATIANTINVYGFNFDPAALVKLGNQNLTTTFIGGSYLQAEIPAGVAPGPYDVTVQNPGNVSAVKPNGYTAIEGGNDDLYSYSSQLWTDPVAPRAGQATDVGLVVNRQGGKQVLSNVPVNFYVGDSIQGGQSLGTGTILLLSPRSSVSTSAVKWTPAAPGSYTLWALIDPDNLFAESIETNNTVSRTLTVLTQSADEIAPHVDSFSVNGGASQTLSQTVQLDTSASDPDPSSGLKSLLFQEYEYSQSSSQWVPVKNSGWLDYETARANHNWTLLPSAGVKYLQAWASDRAGNVSIFPFRAFVNYGPPTDRVGVDQTRIYRYEMQAGDQLTAKVDPVTGDPDLYVWPPDSDTRPPWVSNLTGNTSDDVSFIAPVAGVYQVEVYGYSAAEYRLTVEITPAARVREVLPGGGEDPNKTKRSQPLISSSNTPGNQQALPTAPTAPDAPAATQQKVFLPAVTR